MCAVSPESCILAWHIKGNTRGTSNRRAHDVEAITANYLVGAVGVEPTTNGLKGRCSTTELRSYIAETYYKKMIFDACVCGLTLRRGENRAQLRTPIGQVSLKSVGQTAI
jgi:hypothetical protein